MKRHLLIVVFFSGLVTSVAAQPPSNKIQLEREKKQIQNELKEIQGVYAKVKAEKTHSLNQLNILKRKMALQEKYIITVNKELQFIDNDVYRGNQEIYHLERQLDALKAEYANTVVYTYKNRSNFDYVNFIFSAGSFNDVLRRITYLRNYRTYREKQVATINETQDIIAKRQQQQLLMKKEKNDVLEDQAKERIELDEQRKEKDVVVSKLKARESDLQKQIVAKKKRDKDLQKAISAIILKELNPTKPKTEKSTTVNSSAVTKNNVNITTKTTRTKKPGSYPELKEAEIRLEENFENNKGKLPWPVDNSFIQVPFGKYTIDGIIGYNPGITIGTSQPGAPVKAVFDGVVSAIYNYGDGIAIIIRHGKYFTSYSNLSGVSVTKGTTVKRGQVIGKAGDADDGTGRMVDFMLMIESNNVNPAQWLRR